ncbi:MAG TPA: hypothetical protein PLU53_12630 [Bacteroidia bacterium]|nr:hypothetical protein [Bacteroidia bacterium]
MMHRFYLQTSLFIFISVLALIVMGIRIEKKDPADYLSSIIDKHKRLESLESPRLILSGGSNLAFGIDSRRMEEELKIPVVNLGLHAGLGLEFILNELSAEMKNGDKVIISLEYYLSKAGEYQLKHKAAEYLPGAGNYFSQSIFGDIRYAVERKRNALKDNFIYVKNGLLSIAGRASENTLRTNVYRRDCFNEYGDVVCHLNEKSTVRTDDIDPFVYSEYEGISLLNEFYRKAKKLNVRVYFMYPNLPVSVYRENIDCIGKYTGDISTKLEMPVLNAPFDFVYNDSLFYDTVYHLNGPGRQKRTSDMIRLIQKAGIFEKMKSIQYGIQNSAR